MQLSTPTEALYAMMRQEATFFNFHSSKHQLNTKPNTNTTQHNTNTSQHNQCHNTCSKSLHDRYNSRNVHISRNKQINKQKQLNWNIELDSSESGTCDTFFMDTVQAGCQYCAGQFSNCYFASSLLHTVHTLCTLHSLAWLLICKNVPRTPRARLAGGCTASVCTCAMQCAVNCASVCTCAM